MTTIQKASFATAMVVLLGGAIYEAKLAVLLRTQNQKLQQEQAALVEQNQQLQSERENARMRLTELLAENSSLKANPNEKELIRLRGELTRLQSSGNDATAIAAKAWLAKVSKLKQRLQASPGAWIPEMQFLTEQDWLSVTRNNLNTDADFRRALAELRHEGENKLAALAWKPALEGYSQANGGQFPADLSELLPYFVLPVDDTIVQRWKIVPAKDVPNVGVGEMVITQRSAVDELLDSRMAIGANGYGSMDWLTSETQDTLKPVYSSFRNANPNLTSFDPTQLLAFATTSSQRAAVRKLIDQKALKK